MNKWEWKVEDDGVYIVCGSKKIAKMLREDFTEQEFVNNTTTITVTVNDYLETKNRIATQLTETI